MNCIKNNWKVIIWEVDICFDVLKVNWFNVINVDVDKINMCLKYEVKYIFFIILLVSY